MMARGKKKESTLTPEEKLAQALVPVEEQPYKVPENWCWTTVGKVATVVTGGTPSKNHPEYYDGAFPFYKPSDLDAGRYVYEAFEYLSDEGKAVSRIIPQDSTAVCCIGSIGKCGYITREGTTNQQINSAIPRFNPLYLYYFLNTDQFVNELWSKASATTISIVNKWKMEQCYFPLAPLAEQQRIVDRVEYLFAKLDEAKEKAQSVLDSFETRKAAILNKAFTGELTAKWRAGHGVSDDSWSTVGITRIAKPEKDALKAGPFGSALKKSMYVPEGYKIYGQEQVIAGDETIGDYYIDENKYQELISCKIAPHDILISLVGTVGKVLVLSDECKPGIINPRLIKVSLDERIMMPYFFKYYFESDSLKEKYKGESHGITMDVLNMRILKMLPFPLCTLNEQTEIVRILDSLLTKEQQAKEVAEAVLEKIELLKKSILARAFRGELGTNDPTEESAQELLKSIL